MAKLEDITKLSATAPLSMRYFCGHIKLIAATKNAEQGVSVAISGRFRELIKHLNLAASC